MDKNELVFPEFDYKIHVVDSFDIPEHWERYITTDENYVNPSVAAWFAENPDTGAIYLYREIYKTQLTKIEFYRMITDYNHDEKYTYISESSNKNVAAGLFMLAKRLNRENPTIFFFMDSLVHPVDEHLPRGNDYGIREFFSYSRNADRHTHYPFIDATRRLCLSLNKIDNFANDFKWIYK